jgi:hypothetical protein
VSDNIERLDVDIDPLEVGEFLAFREPLWVRPWAVCVGDSDFVHLTRHQFSALVRWGAAALARTHPSRAKRAGPCDHRHQMGTADAMVCAGCGETLRGGAVPTYAEGAE